MKSPLKRLRLSKDRQHQGHTTDDKQLLAGAQMQTVCVVLVIRVGAVQGMQALQKPHLAQKLISLLELVTPAICFSLIKVTLVRNIDPDQIQATQTPKYPQSLVPSWELIESEHFYSYCWIILDIGQRLP